MEPLPDLRNLFSLDFKVHFLNHGSFGACPKEVFAVYQEWQRRLEQQPVLFLGRQMIELDQQARQALADYTLTQPENLVFIPNATHGVNIITRSLPLVPGDQILTTDHEYGACDYAWEFVCQKTGAEVVRQTIPLPISHSEEILERFWQGLTPRTKVIYLSHISSPTALRLPVEAICARARSAGIVTVIDGAHAPGQIPLNLENLGADFYTGNLHKWTMAPKGAAFLYAHPRAQPLVEPLVVSWGYHADPLQTRGSRFLDHLGWTGTHDPAAYLTVPAAIRFAQKHNWEQVRQQCHEKLKETIVRVCELTGMEPLYPTDSDLYFQMGIAPLPLDVDPVQLKASLYDEHHVEVPVTGWNGRSFVRVSVQGYNTQEDLDALVHGLRDCLKRR
jgi:isopenicillin-N epimerase